MKQEYILKAETQKKPRFMYYDTRCVVYNIKEFQIINASYFVDMNKRYLT